MNTVLKETIKRKENNMSITVMSEKVYAKACTDGDKICLMCGQHNTKDKHYCWYCGSNHVVDMAEANCIRSSDRLPVSRADNSYTVDSMIVRNMSEFNKRVEAFKLATKETV